mmetsp:Transcript_11852/g.29216  ORF Transcript_11852/g.29216 Transcript_11852/m.29216 type:complete len:160 (+) Transcript_11852:275-754(+)
MISTREYRRALRGTQIACSFVAFVCIWSLGGASLIAQIENLGLITGACFVYTSLVFSGGELTDFPHRFHDIWMLMEFALDFVFVILTLSGSVTMFVKCREISEGNIPFCSSQSPYINQPNTASLAVACGLLCCVVLCLSLTIDYNKWLQSHVKYDDYDG